MRTATVGHEGLSPRDEAGTAPGDRRFRPDVEGLRAVAIALVVLYHANVPRITGGFVGVDVFFVISGFVITGLLLRQQSNTGATSLVGFYSRRARRIIPAAALVIVVTVLLSYHVLGYVGGNGAAVDGRWATIFLSNFHFEATGTNYLASFLPPSPLQNYWSLSVEEQFYAVFPLLFLIVATTKVRLSMKARLGTVLSLIIVSSFVLSVVQTPTNPTVAFFSPFTRAWELALGGLIAVATQRLAKTPTAIAAVMTWIGLAMILIAGLALNARSAYPGYLVALPVLGAGLIIAGGAAVPRHGVETLLAIAPFRLLGRVSYSLYLWHWPILILAAESRGQTSLAAPESLWWVALAVAVSIGSYLLVENPVRHAQSLSRAPWRSIGVGAVLTLLTLGVLTAGLGAHGGSAIPSPSNPSRPSTVASPMDVQRLVQGSSAIETVPPNLTPSAAGAFFDFGIPSTWNGCSATYAQTSVPACTFGDANGTHTMVLLGDSHALMWAQALNDVATMARWRFVLLAKAGCPATDLSVGYPAGFSAPKGEWAACDRWHQTTVARINKMDPAMVIVTQDLHARPNGERYTPLQWERGVEQTLNSITSDGTERILLGDIPLLPQSGPQCIARNPGRVQACSGPPHSPQSQYDQAEAVAASASGARYVNVTPWFCDHICSPIVGHYEVYVDRYHVTNTYAEFLEGVLGQALRLPVLQNLNQAPFETRILDPKHVGTVSKEVTLDASALDKVRVEKVEFQLSNGSRSRTNIAAGTLTLDGWIGRWDSASVPNGVYALRSVATDGAGNVATSRPVTITVRN